MFRRPAVAIKGGLLLSPTPFSQIRRATSGGAVPSASSKGARPGPTENAEMALALGNLYKWAIESGGVRVHNVVAQSHPMNHPGKGLVATAAHREGTTLVSAPLKSFGINAEKLRGSEWVRNAQPPKSNFIHQEMLAAGVRDLVIADQIYFALLLAIERMNPNSSYAPYFNSLPHPAMDDDAILQLHADSLTELDLLQWRALREDYLAVLKDILRRWDSPVKAAKPPIQVLDWAWRTVLSRQQLLPDHGAPPPIYNKMGFVSWFLMNGDRTFVQRLKDRLFNPKAAELDYDLVPTLIPFIDLVDHAPAANVSIEVADRGSFGTCVELQAVTEIREGEELGLTYSRAHSIGFTLYRFGFIPQ